MLIQLIYISKKNCSEDEILKILEKSRKKNQEKNISGFLVYSEMNFIQCLEGEYKTVLDLYDIIKIDERHKNTVLISLSSIKDRTFPTWAMGAKKLDFDKMDFLSDLTEEEKKTFIKLISGEETSKAIDVIKKLI